MTKYIFLDIDGTLYSSKTNQTPESALYAIQSARKKGHKIFLCTGRSLAEIVTFLNYDIDGYILGAGAKVYADKKCIFDHPIPKAELAELKRTINGLQMGYALEGNAGAYGNRIGYEFQLKYFSQPGSKRDEQIQNAMGNCVYPEDAAHEDDEIYKICVYSEDGSEFSKLENLIGDKYAMTKVAEDKEKRFYVEEITDMNINKATGIQKVLDYYHADREDAVGIGDSGNDIPMLQYCGISVAMGNGADAVKEAADYVTRDILEDGILHAFRHFSLIDEE